MKKGYLLLGRDWNIDGAGKSIGRDHLLSFKSVKICEYYDNIGNCKNGYFIQTIGKWNYIIRFYRRDNRVCTSNIVLLKRHIFENLSSRDIEEAISFQINGIKRTVL